MLLCISRLLRIQEGNLHAPLLWNGVLVTLKRLLLLLVHF